VRSQNFLSVTDAIAVYSRKHARNCVRRVSGLVLTRYTEKGLSYRLVALLLRTAYSRADGAMY
jgi:hypothetical protein